MIHQTVKGDQYIVRKYGDIYKLVYMPYYRDSGNEKKVSRETLEVENVFVSKRENNLSRAKSTIWELVVCNDWQYFVTLTLSPEKVNDRNDLPSANAKIRKLVAGMNAPDCDGRYRKNKVKYLLVPEKHVNGAWHLHGFIDGLTWADLRKNSNGFLEWRQYADKLGYMNMSEIRDKNRCASYVKKYITKDLGRSVSECHAHLYYCSLGLKRSEVVYKGCADYRGSWEYIHPDGFCRIATLTQHDLDNPDIIQFMMPAHSDVGWVKGGNFNEM